MKVPSSTYAEEVKQKFASQFDITETTAIRVIIKKGGVALDGVKTLAELGVISGDLLILETGGFL